MTSPVTANGTADGLTREQLLSAIDFEINGQQALKTSTGRTRWALTLGISALLWLGIKLWESGGFAAKNVLILSVAMTIWWDFLLKTKDALDSSILPRGSNTGNFIAISHLMGALRSTIAFIGVKNAAMLAAILWCSMPGSKILVAYLCYTLISVVLGFVVSFTDFPPIPVLDPPARSRLFLAVLRIFPWVLRVIVAIASMYSVLHLPTDLVAADLRLGVVIAALVYLLTKLVDDQFAITHLNTLRTVRQNLAFNRLSVEQTESQIDLLLLSGSSGTRAVQRTTDSILSDVEEVRGSYLQIGTRHEKSKSVSSSVWDEMHVEHSQQAGAKSLGEQFDETSRRHDKLVERIKTFRSLVEFTKHVSVSAHKEIFPLTEKLHAALKPLEAHRESLRSAVKKVA